MIGLDYGTASVSRRRLKKRTKHHGKLRQQYAEIERRLSKGKDLTPSVYLTFPRYGIKVLLYYRNKKRQL